MIPDYHQHNHEIAGVIFKKARNMGCRFAFLTKNLGSTCPNFEKQNGSIWVCHDRLSAPWNKVGENGGGTGGEAGE